MADSNSRSAPPSFIPVPRNSLSLALPRPSLQTSPAPTTTSSSIPSFRSLKNLLPFGPSKSTPNYSTSSAPKGPFSNFGSVRRSINGERKKSGTQDEIDDTPVIAIDATSPNTVVEEVSDEAANLGASNQAVDDMAFRVDDPLPAAGTDLSTIIEAENSGISKHIPSTDDSQRSPSVQSGESLRLPILSPRTPTASGSRTPDSLDTSAIDLSTSRLTAEVLDAMMESSPADANEWLNGVNAVVVDAAPEQGLDMSFNFGSLDPDLAALLSPNRLSDQGTSRPASLKSTHSTSLLPSATVSPIPIRALGPQSSPIRRSASLSKSTSSRPPTSLPRLTRTPLGTPISLETKSSPDRTSFAFQEDGRRASSDSLPRRRQPPSPLANAAIARSYSSDLSSRRPAQSRLVTPARHASYSVARLRHALTASTASPPWDADSISPSSRAPSSLGTSDTTRRVHRPRPSIDGDTSTHARTRALLYRHRKRSMSVDDPSPGSASSAFRTPSSFASTHAPPSPAEVSDTASRLGGMDWLGPRTTKAFAAAGLLSLDRDDRTTHLPHSASEHPRYGAALSEASHSHSQAGGSVLSWGRSRSGSRTLASASEAGRPPTDSPTLSIPRTTFSASAPSTAPTSASGSSSHAHALAQAQALQALREKHDVATEALLAALSDSQRAGKAVQAENAALRGRVQVLEHQLDEAGTYIRHLLLEAAPARTSYPQTHPRGVRSRRGSVDERRAHLPLSTPAPAPALAPAFDGAGAVDATFAQAKGRKRFSTASSVFPVLPSNMTMLMHEEGGLSERSVSRSPPEAVYGASSWAAGRTHRRNRTASSGNLSRTTASFSMTERTGSPGSLYLRPEHEVHLGDMASLNLRGDEEEEEDEDEDDF